MDPAMLVIILKVVRLRNHQILAKDPRVNQAFQDLFAGKEVTTRTGLVTKATFNNVLTKALEDLHLLSQVNLLYHIYVFVSSNNQIFLEKSKKKR